MFDIFFGWSKASKCKKAIKRAKCRLRLLKNKRHAIVRQLRQDLAELIQSGHEETALKRVDQLIEDESLAAVYELLDNFCEFILTQLSYIRRHKDCPNDINEAVSSLIYASARCGDLPELCVIRKLFGERYGKNFATAAVELFPGNLVNKQLKESLSGKSLSDDLKYRVVDEIARDHCPQQQVLAIQYYPDRQQEQVKENRGYHLVEHDGQTNSALARSKVHPSSDVEEETKRDATCFKSSVLKPSYSCSLPPESIMSYPSQNKVEKAIIGLPELLSYSTSGQQNKVERMALASSAESEGFPPYDDIEEYQFSVSRDGASQDQMLYSKFRPSYLPSRKKTQIVCDESDMDQDESLSEMSSTRTFRKSKRRVPRKRSRRRSASLESVGIMDIGYMIYYHHRPCKSPSPHKHNSHSHKKHQKPSLSLEGIPSSYVQKRLKQYSSSEKENVSQSCQNKDGTKRKSPFNFKMNRCSLYQPCYFCHCDDKDSLEALSLKPNRGIRDSHVQQEVLVNECSHFRPFWDDELELISFPQKPNRKSYSGVVESHVFNKGTEAENSASMGNYASSNVSNPRTNSSLTRIEMEEAPYSRAMTMPQERQRNCRDKMFRTYSCPSPHPNHVHPKLPDYDDIAAKFSALKRECLENKGCMQ